MSRLTDQLSQIKEGGLPVLHRKGITLSKRLSTLALYIINSIWAVPGVILIRIARPLVHVRLGTLFETRIGHFVIDATIFLAQKHSQTARERTVDMFWFSRKTSNEQWARMVRRQLFVHWWVKYLYGFNKIIPGGEAHTLLLPSDTGPGYDNILFENNVCFEFTLEEGERAKEWLRRRGWQDGEPFVCLQARDSAYMSLHQLHSGGNYTYHNYRDTDIDTYIEAIQALVSKGYWVIRLGKIMHKRLSLKHEKVIDYPFVDDQDDLMDIWLSATCQFFISTASGLVHIPAIYKKPIVFVNALPLVIGFFWTNRIWVPKNLFWEKSGKELTLKEYCGSTYGMAKEYEDAKITIVDLLPSEITAAVLECEGRSAGTWVETPEDIVLQHRFWDVLSECPDFYTANSPDNIHPEARAGQSWLAAKGSDFFD